MTPTDYPDRVRALLEAATPEPWEVSERTVGVEFYGDWYAAGPALIGAGERDGDPLDLEAQADAALIAEAPTLARAYLDLHAEVERLSRILADRAAGGAA